MKRRAWSSYVNMIVLVVCAITAFILYNNTHSEGYKYLYLLPIAYAIALMIFSPLIRGKCTYKRGIAYYIAQLVLAYRYILLPLACQYTDTFGGWTAYGTNGFGREPQSSSIIAATLWMCTEVFAAEFAIYLGTLITARMERRRQKRSNDFGQEPDFLRYKTMLIVFCVFAFALLIIFQRQLFTQFLVLNSNYSVGANATSGSLFKLIFLAFRFGFLMLGYSYCARKYQKKRKKVWIVGALFFLFIYIGYSVGASRWNLVLPTLASIAIFRESFKPFSKGMVLSAIIIVSIGALSISFYKFGYLIEAGSNRLESMLLIVFQQSNEYFSGPRSIAQGLEMLSHYGNQIDLSTFFNSIFSGFAGLASLTQDADKLQSFFNYYALGLMQDRPLICPILVEGLGFFSIFPWIYILLFEIGMCILDYKSETANAYEMRFIFVHLGMWFALCFCLNTKLEMSQISQNVPVMLLFWFNSKVRVRLYMSSKRQLTQRQTIANLSV